MPTQEELTRALRRDVDANAFAGRRRDERLDKHDGRIEKIERELADRYVLPVAPPPRQEATPYRGGAIELSGYGPDTTTIILKAVDAALEGRKDKEARGIVEWGKGLRNKVAETLVIAFCVAVAGLLTTLLILQAVRTMNVGHGEPTPHELDHGAP